MRKILISIFLLSTLLGASFFSFIDSSLVEAEEDCSTLEECQSLLSEYEKQISAYESDIAQNKAQQQTLNNKIYLLRQKVSKLELEIKHSDLIIRDLEVQIDDTSVSIENTSAKINELRLRLVEILRTIYEEDQKTSLEILLSSNQLSDFFENLVALESLLSKNKDVLEEIKVLKQDLESQKESLDVERYDWEKMQKVQILQKAENQRTKQEQEWLLSETRGEEAEYQKLLAESKEKANKIRQRLFSLIGVADAPTFGEALEMAKYVEGLTGVRPAFLLAILTQESNIGKNVGQCYLRDPQAGSGIVARTGQTLDRVMKPSRDVQPFLQICRESGRDPYNTLVSCPMSFGYGGAMGPAQFIPSTWNMYRNRLSIMLGRPADPWNIKDAFLAAGLLLSDSGASAGTYNAEWRAAMIYFSGSTNPAYSFYGNSVMNIVAGYEKDIAQLEKYSN